VGSFLELRSAQEQAVGVELIDPDGGRPLSLKEAASAQSYPLAREGFWELRRANGRHELVAVNADRRESDLSVIPQETLDLWAGNRGTTGQSENAATGETKQAEIRPYSLWWWFMLAALIIAVAESVFAGRYLGVTRETEAAAGG
jgi:hypothetical protein